MTNIWEKLGFKRAAAPVEGRLPVSDRGAGSGSPALRSWGTWGGVAPLSGVGSNPRLEVTNPLHNSAVMACIHFLVTNWPQAIPTVSVPKAESGAQTELEVIPHRLTSLLLRPSKFYDGRLLLQGLLHDFYGAEKRGNAYLYIVLAGGEPVELQHLPSDSMTPVGDDRELISGYEYRVDGELRATIPAAQVIHFRNGFCPTNPRIGIDPFASLYPEIATDNRATQYQYNILKRGGVPPWILAPKSDNGNVEALSEEDARYMKAGIDNAISGTGQGGGVMLPAGFQFEKLGFDPKSMVFGETQRKAEERIAGVLGLPPVVAGLGAGLDRSTYSNYEEARQAAWEDCIIPLQQAFAAEVSSKVIPLYADLPQGAVFGYDTREIRCLMDDESAKVLDAEKLYKGQIIDRATAKRRVGELADDSDIGVYFGDSAIGADIAPPAADPNLADRLTAGKAGKQGRPFERKAAGLSALDDVANTFRRALLAREERAVFQMKAAHRVAEKRIQSDLDALLEQMEEAWAAGETITPDWLEREKRYTQLLIQIEDAYTQLGNDASPKLADSQLSVAMDAIKSSRILAQAAIGSGPQGVAIPWNQLPVSALESFVGFASDGSPLADLLAAIGPDAGQKIKDALIAGIAAGENPRKTALLIREAVQGVVEISRQRSETIARTEMLRASREATRRSYAENSDVLDGYQRLCAGDSRVCAACLALQGTLYKSNQILPSHPSCRCVMAPRTKSWGEILDDESIPDTREAVASPDAIFARLSAADQKQVLGAAGYAAWESGAVQLTDFARVSEDTRWGPTVRRATLDELGVSTNES